MRIVTDKRLKEYTDRAFEAGYKQGKYAEHQEAKIRNAKYKDDVARVDALTKKIVAYRTIPMSAKDFYDCVKRAGMEIFNLL